MKIARAGILVVFLGLSWVTTTAQQTAAPVAQDKSMAARTAPVPAGETAPDFTLADEEGRTVQLSAARGKSPVVLVFYRGYW